MKFRKSRAVSVHDELYFGSDNALITGVEFQLRKAEANDPILTGYLHDPEYDFHLIEFLKGRYARLVEGGYYDIVHNRAIQSALSPIFVPDTANFVTGDDVIAPTGWFGDGSDGSYTLDGVQASVSGLFTRVSATEYVLLRDAFFVNLTVSLGVTLKPSGFRVFANGTLTLNGVISGSGTNGGNGGAGESGTPSASGGGDGGTA